jgi:hypothetical protein
MNWNGAVREWEIIGFSYDMDEQGPTAAGGEPTFVNFRTHLARKYQFYLWKTLLPNCMIAIFTFLTPFFPSDVIAERISYIATLVVSTLALLFVVGESLPKLDSLTLIDKCMFLTMSIEIILALSSVAVLYYHTLRGEAFAVTLDLYVSAAVLAAYLFLNAHFCAKVVRRRKEHWGKEIELGCVPMEQLQEKSRQQVRAKAAGEGRAAIVAMGVAT